MTTLSRHQAWLTTAARPHLIDFIGRWSYPGRPNLLLPGLRSVPGLDVLVPRLARVVEGLGEVSAHVSNINGGTTTAAHVHVGSPYRGRG